MHLPFKYPQSCASDISLQIVDTNQPRHKKIVQFMFRKTISFLGGVGCCTCVEPLRLYNAFCHTLSRTNHSTKSNRRGRSELAHGGSRGTAPRAYFYVSSASWRVRQKLWCASCSTRENSTVGNFFLCISFSLFISNDNFSYRSTLIL